MASRLLNFKQGLGVSINNDSACVLHSVRASKAVSAQASGCIHFFRGKRDNVIVLKIKSILKATNKYKG